MIKKTLFVIIILFSFCLYTLAKPEDKAAPVKKDEKAQDQPKEDFLITNYILGISGGYFIPIGDISIIYLTPDFSLKLFFEYNKENASFIGLGLETGYAYLKDKTNRGDFLYYSILPYLTMNIFISNILDLQLKFLAGVTILNAGIDSGSEINRITSVSLTIGGGFAITKTFFKRWYVGLEADVYYYFGKPGDASFAAYLITGVRL